MQGRQERSSAITYYSRLWYSHERGYATADGEHSLLLRVRDHRQERRSRDFLSYRGFYWYHAPAHEDFARQRENEQWELVRLAEAQASAILGRWQGHVLREGGPFTMTYYAQIEDASLEQPTEIVRQWSGPGGLWYEGYLPGSGAGWQWTETWLRARFKGDGLLAEVPEEYAREIIGRWKQEEEQESRERAYYARLWYAPGPGRKAQEKLSPLLRRSTDSVPPRDEVWLPGGRWMATAALQAWESGESAYEYIEISKEQATMIAQCWSREAGSGEPER